MIQSLSTSKVAAVTAVTSASTVVPSPSTVSVTKGNKKFLCKISTRNMPVLLYASGLTLKLDLVTVGSFLLLAGFELIYNDIWGLGNLQWLPPQQSRKHRRKYREEREYSEKLLLSTINIHHFNPSLQKSTEQHVCNHSHCCPQNSDWKSNSCRIAVSFPCQLNDQTAWMFWVWNISCSCLGRVLS